MFQPGSKCALQSSATLRLHVVPDAANMQLRGCMNTDRIEKKILLHAPLKRVWRALADSKEFGAWFGMKFDGPFAPGSQMRGVITPTTVDAAVAEAQKQYEGTPFEITIDQMLPERLFS